MKNSKSIKVTLRTRTVGQCFGTIGQIVARNGRVLAEGEVRPYGFTAAALVDVEQTAADRGYLVLSDEERIEAGI